MPALKRFSNQIAIITIILALATYFGGGFIEAVNINLLFAILLSMGVLYFANYYVLLKISKLRLVQFSNYFMILTTSKLFLFIIVISLVLYNYKKPAVPYIIYFMLIYLIYTTFEVFSIVQFLKNKN